MERARQLAQQGRHREAVLAIEQAAESGDSEALLTMANWRLFGVYGPRDLDQAHQLLSSAAEHGSSEAARTRALLIGNGTGCPSDPERAKTLLTALRDSDPYAALQLAFLPKMLPIEQVGELAVEVQRENPSVRIVRGLLLESECRYLMTLAEPALQPSSVIDPQSGKRIPHPVRTSAGMSFGPVNEDLVVHAINRRLAAVTGTDVSWGEPLHILRYSPRQEYKPHVDALPGVVNQRAWTILVYLNEDFAGGETRFTEIGLTTRGKAGDAVIFRNTLDDGRADPRTRHAGLPVTSGTKWLATRWIRQAPYSPWTGD